MTVCFAWFDQRKEVCPIRRVGWSYSKTNIFPSPQLLAVARRYLHGRCKRLASYQQQAPADHLELPQLQLSNVIINGESVNDKLNGNPKGISLLWNSNITIRIMSKEEDIFRQKVYKYQIEGLNDQQIESLQP